MNILILDKDKLIFDAISYFGEFEKHWNFFDYDSMVKKSLTYKNMNLVIVDVGDDRFKPIYNDILKFDKNKRIIVFSDKLKSCDPLDCEVCKGSYQVRRLMKPLELNKLYNLILSFKLDCEFFNAFDDISGIIENIIKRYRSLDYNKVTKDVEIRKHSSSSTYTHELLAFIDLLERNSVTYTIIDERNIRIT